MSRGEALAAAILASVTVSACAVGPHYVRRSAPAPPAFKEEAAPGQRPEDWKPAEPRDAVPRGPWWEAFGDPELSALEGQVDLANQDVARAEANYRVARALARGARADLLPTVTGGAGVTISHNGNRSSGQGTTSSSTSRTTTYQVPIDLSWEADVFGRIRRNLEANVAEAQASAADLESIRLTLHAELATDWFLLKGLDAERRLLDEAIDGYARALELNRNRHDQGIVSGVDVAQAETQLETTRVEATDLEIDRAQLEHAIAVLVGKAPADLTLPPSPIDIAPPPIPAMLPAELLERRPDIAAAERRVAAANAQVGVATAAFFPRLLLAASAGLQSTSLGSLFSAPSRFWSLGPSLVQTLFSGGRRRAAVDQARASYDGAVAAYRQSALGAFQEVEDGLAAQRILGVEAAQEAAAVAASDRLVAIARNRYNGGITTYLEVVTAEQAALSNHRAAVQLLTRRLTNGVGLVKALGGGWDAASLPPANAVLAGESANR